MTSLLYEAESVSKQDHTLKQKVVQWKAFQVGYFSMQINGRIQDFPDEDANNKGLRVR